MPLSKNEALKSKAVVVRSKKKRSKAIKKRWIGWLFILPGLLFHIFAVTIPAIMSFLLPFTEWNGFSNPSFVGFSNFLEAFNDPIVWTAFLNNVKWCLFWVVVPIVFALCISLLLRKVTRGQTVYQVIYFSTSIITVTVAGQIWLWIISPFKGLNFFLKEIGLGFLQWPGLTQDWSALLSVLIADMWTGFGFFVIWILSSLTQLSKPLEDAAKIDGAGRLRIIWNVILPQLRPTLVVIVFLVMMASFSAFEMVYVMTKGGPAHATETLSTYYYTLTTTGRRIGYASAVSLFQISIALVIIFTYAYLRKKKGWDV